MDSLTEKTQSKLLEAMAKGGSQVLNKAFTLSSGLVNIDLEPAAKILYPVITPLRNMIPRRKGDGGTAAQWRAITGINTGTAIRPGVAEGYRSGAISTTTASYLAGYKVLGLEDSVTFESQEAGEGFDNIVARAVEGLLRAMMIAEEKTILGGNTSLALATTPTPSLNDAGSGGSIGTGTAVYVACVALTHDGYLNASVTGGIPKAISQVSLNSETTTFGGGSAQKSASANLTTGASSDSIEAVVTPVQGAFGYAWIWGATEAGATLGAITTVNYHLIQTATGTGTQTYASIAAADCSTNAYVYDGLLYLALGAGQQNPAASASGSLVKCHSTAFGGTNLTADGAGGVVELDEDLKSFWDNYRLSPTHIFVGSGVLIDITTKVIAGGGAPLFRFNMDGNGGSVNAGTVQGGAVIGTYLNKFSMDGGALVKVILHPNMPDGAIFYYCNNIPYPLSNVSDPVVMKTRREYYQNEWPLRTRRYEYGVYVSEVLQHYFPPAMGVRYNITRG